MPAGHFLLRLDKTHDKSIQGPFLFFPERRLAGRDGLPPLFNAKLRHSFSPGIKRLRKNNPAHSCIMISILLHLNSAVFCQLRQGVRQRYHHWSSARYGHSLFDSSLPHSPMKKNIGAESRGDRCALNQRKKMLPTPVLALFLLFLLSGPAVAVAAGSGTSPENKETACVILLHGLARTSASMDKKRSRILLKLRSRRDWRNVLQKRPIRSTLLPTLSVELFSVTISATIQLILLAEWSCLHLQTREVKWLTTGSLFPAHAEQQRHSPGKGVFTVRIVPQRVTGSPDLQNHNSRVIKPGGSRRNTRRKNARISTGGLPFCPLFYPVLSPLFADTCSRHPGIDKLSAGERKTVQYPVNSRADSSLLLDRHSHPRVSSRKIGITMSKNGRLDTKLDTK